MSLYSHTFTYDDISNANAIDVFDELENQLSSNIGLLTVHDHLTVQHVPDASTSTEQTLEETKVVEYDQLDSSAGTSQVMLEKVLNREQNEVKQVHDHWQGEQAEQAILQNFTSLILKNTEKELITIIAEMPGPLYCIIRRHEMLSEGLLNQVKIERRKIQNRKATRRHKRNKKIQSRLDVHKKVGQNTK